MNGSISIRKIQDRMLSLVALLVTMFIAVAYSGPSASANNNDREPSRRSDAQVTYSAPIVFEMSMERYVEIWVLDCAGTGDCTPQGWADFWVSDGDVTLTGMSQENGYVGAIGPFHADSISIKQGYHAIEEEPLVRCGEREIDLETGQPTDLNDTVWTDLEIDSGLFIYTDFDAPLLTCFIVSNQP